MKREYYLYVKKEKDGWVVSKEYAKDAAETLELFGGFVLPLPFTNEATEREVMTSLSRLNPDHNIVNVGTQHKLAAQVCV